MAIVQFIVLQFLINLMDQQKYVQDHNDNRDIDMDELHELLGT